MCDQQSLRSACAYAQSDQSLCLSLEYSMIVKLLTEHHLEFLSLRGGCRGSSESTHVKMPPCWKSHGLAQMSTTGNCTKRLPLSQTHRYYTNRMVFTLYSTFKETSEANHALGFLGRNLKVFPKKIVDKANRALIRSKKSK